jgi:hypothetical protein
MEEQVVDEVGSGRKLGDVLAAEYLAFKRGLREGRRARDLSDMTDREQAGLWLHTYHLGALDAFDGMPRGGCNPWPKARELIADAIRVPGFTKGGDA